MFDIDGTLLQTMRVSTLCFVRALEESIGFQAIDQNLAGYRDMTEQGIMNELFENRLGRLPSNEEIRRAKSRFVDLLGESHKYDPDQFRRTPGATELLRRIIQHPEWCVALATGAWEEAALLKLSSSGLAIDGIPLASSNDAVSRKEIMKIALARARQHYQMSGFTDVVYVGDGVWDVEAARSLGYGFLGIGEGTAADKLREAGASCVVSDFRRVESVLELLQGAPRPNIPAGIHTDR